MLLELLTRRPLNGGETGFFLLSESVLKHVIGTKLLKATLLLEHLELTVFALESSRLAEFSVFFFLCLPLVGQHQFGLLLLARSLRP